MSDDQMWAPETLDRPPICAAVDSFGRTFGGAICPVHGGSRCPVEFDPPRPVVDIEALAAKLRAAYMTASRVEEPADWPDVPECQREAWRAVARAAVAP